MTDSRPAVRIPVLLLAAVLAIALVGVGARAAVSAPPLPETTADELLGSALVTAADPPPVAGELTLTLGLGLPSVPGLTDGDGGVAAELLDGASRLRVERSDDGVRAALLGDRSERLVVTDGSELWTWDSTTLEATRYALPEGVREEREAADLSAFDPAALGARLLQGVEEGASVELDRTARVAGRDAYRLVVTPDDEQTTVGRLEVDVDAEERVPLRLALFAEGAAEPSVEMAWSSVSFAPVDPATFSFTPPPGATVREGADALAEAGNHADGPAGDARPPGAPLMHDDDGAVRHAPGASDPGAASMLPTAVGEGLSTVFVLPAPVPSAAPDGGSEPDGGEAGAQLEALLPLDGPLLSATTAITSTGERVLVAGLVPLARLDEVAAGIG